MNINEELQIRRDLLCAKIELESMLSENKKREINCESLAYGESEILNLINRYGLGENSFVDRMIEY